jgi:hypothetical protein
MRTRGIKETLLTALLVWSACGGEAADDAAMEGAGEDSAAETGGVESMVGAADRAQNTVAVAEMRSHLNVLTAAGGDEMVAMVPQHRQRVESFITQLSGTGASANPAWGPTVDSVRQDLSRMQGMPANELEVLVEGNAERATRLIEMYEASTGGAQPR